MKDEIKIDNNSIEDTLHYLLEEAIKQTQCPDPDPNKDKRRLAWIRQSIKICELQLTNKRIKELENQIKAIEIEINRLEIVAFGY